MSNVGFFKALNYITHALVGAGRIRPWLALHPRSRPWVSPTPTKGGRRPSSGLQRLKVVELRSTPAMGERSRAGLCCSLMPGFNNLLQACFCKRRVARTLPPA